MGVTLPVTTAVESDGATVLSVVTLGTLACGSVGGVDPVPVFVLGVEVAIGEEVVFWLMKKMAPPTTSKTTIPPTITVFVFIREYIIF